MANWFQLSIDPTAIHREVKGGDTIILFGSEKVPFTVFCVKDALTSMTAVRVNESRDRKQFLS